MIMFCPHCGKEVDFDAIFCPHCGRGISSSYEPAYYESSYYEDPLQSNRKSSSRKAIGIVAVAVILSLILVVTVCSVVLLVNDEPSESRYVVVDTPSETAVVRGYGDFANGNFQIEFNDDDQIIITLSDSLASKYSYFKWTLIDLHHTKQVSSGLFSGTWFSEYTGSTLSKAEPVLIWSEPEVGEYRLNVICYDKDFTNHKEYSGTLLYDDYIFTTYSWTYDNVDYSIEIDYKLSEYLEYSDPSRIDSGLRNGQIYSQITQFCEVNDVVQTIAYKLSEEYLNTYGPEASTSGQQFAEFILAFVNICFDYPPNTNDPDTYVYGQIEYWAFPMETIYYGMGDCEDTSILCASLFKAAGYDSAVVILPSHAIAAVALDEFKETEEISSRLFLFNEVVKGKTYYGCETTLDTNSYGVGYISSSYSDYDGDNFYTL